MHKHDTSGAAGTAPARRAGEQGAEGRNKPCTVLLVITRTANPDSAAISTRALPADLRASFADLLRLPTSVTSSAAIRDELGLTDYGFRRLRHALVRSGHLVHRSAPVDGGWQHLYAVTDMAGTLPAAGELMAMARRTRAGFSDYSGDTDIPGQFGTSIPNVPVSRFDPYVPGQNGTLRIDVRASGRREPTGAPACGDAREPGANWDVEDRRVTGSCSPRRGEASAPGGPPVAAAKTMRRRVAPVEPVREPVRKTPLSVVGTLPALERLARLPEKQRPAGAGPLWVSNRTCLAVAREGDQGTVEQGLRLLGELELPFWFAPKVWSLLDSGWTTDRLRTLFTDRLDGARSMWGVCESRLNAAVPDGQTAAGVLEAEGPAVVSAGGTQPAGPAPASAPEPEGTGWNGEPEHVEGAAPWDLPRESWHQEESASNPGAPAYASVSDFHASLLEGDPSGANEHMRSSVASMREWITRGNEKRRAAEAVPAR